MSEHRSRVEGVDYQAAWADYQGVTIHACRLTDSPRGLVVSVQGHLNADDRCATWDSPTYPMGSEGYDLGWAWIDGDVPSEVYLDWLRENDVTGELEALLEEELKCTA